MTTRVTASVLANTAVTLGTYGGVTQIPVITIDQQGRSTYAANVAISGISIATTQLTGTIANTLITGTFPATSITGLATSATTDTTNANNITSGTLPSARLPTSGVVAGSYGSPTQYPVLTVGADGRVTGVTTQTVTTTTNQTTFGVYSTYQTLSGTGSQTSFTLSQAISGQNTIDVFIGGAFQLPGSANSWTASGNSLVFNNAPPSGTNNITVRYTNQPGAVALIDSTNDSSNTSSGRAATPLAVKTTYDYAASVASYANTNFLKASTNVSTLVLALGVNTAAPGTGAIRATGDITGFYSSDAQFKENIQPISNAVNIVSEIGGKTFDWTDTYINTHGGEDGYFVQKSDFGVIAQDVQKAFPLAVRTREDGSLAVDYAKLSALAFAAITELQKQIDELKGN